MAAIGSVWATDTWDADAWAADTWAGAVVPTSIKVSKVISAASMTRNIQAARIYRTNKVANFTKTTTAG